MRREWLAHCLALARTPADFYSGCRKIIRGMSFRIDSLAGDLSIADCGFTKSKLTMLRRLYLHEESIAAAVTQWKRCKQRDKYSSASFHCYNHYLKSDPTKKSKRASVMGPCIQAVSLSYINKNKFAIDAFYRTTELFKKFPADLIFLRELLEQYFGITDEDTVEVRYHFANITLHPMYFVTLLPLIEDPIKELNLIERHDNRFFQWTVKWTARYICDEYMRGIAKFAQAMRVRQDALNRIHGDKLAELQAYCRSEHPGYRNDYVPPEDEDEE